MRIFPGKGVMGAAPQTRMGVPGVPLTPGPVPARPLPEGCSGAGGAPRRMRRRLPALERPESTERSPDASIDLDLDALETPSGSDGFEWDGETRLGWGCGGPPVLPPPSAALTGCSQRSCRMAGASPRGPAAGRCRTRRMHGRRRAWI